MGRFYDIAELEANLFPEKDFEEIERIPAFKLHDRAASGRFFFSGRNPGKTSAYFAARKSFMLLFAIFRITSSIPFSNNSLV